MTDQRAAAAIVRLPSASDRCPCHFFPELATQAEAAQFRPRVYERDTPTRRLALQCSTSVAAQTSFPMIDTETVSASDSYAQLVAANVLQATSLKLDKSARWADIGILDALCKRNFAQHRRTDYYSKLIAVVRCAKLHDRANVAATWQRLASVIQDLSDANVPIGRTMLVVPTQEEAAAALAQLLADAQLCAQMAVLCTRASELLLSQMAHSFFLPFCLTAASVCATLRISASSHLMQCVSVYNSFVPVAAALPRAKSDGGPLNPSLPESLRVRWVHGLPCVVSQDFPTSAGFRQLAARLHAQHDVAYGAHSISASVTETRTIENGMAARSHAIVHQSLPFFEDVGQARPDRSEQRILFETMPGFSLGSSTPAMSAGLPIDTCAAIHHIASRTMKRHDVQELRTDQDHPCPTRAPSTQTQLISTGNVRKLRDSPTSTEQKTYTAQQSDNPIELSMKESPQPSVIKRNRKVLEGVGVGKGSSRHHDRGHSEGQQSTSSPSQTKQSLRTVNNVPNVMDILTHGSQPKI